MWLTYLVTLHKFEVWGPWKVPQMCHSPFKPYLYVDYGNMIHFAVSAWTSEMSLYTDSPFCPIWWWILSIFNRPSEVQAFSTYELGLNGLCHIRGTFYWPQDSNLWSVRMYTIVISNSCTFVHMFMCSMVMWNVFLCFFRLPSFSDLLSHIRPTATSYWMVH